MLQERLRRARRAAHMTGAEVAAKIGVSDAAYSYFEHGLKNPSLTTMIRIAKLLNVSIDYLVGLDNTDEQNKEKQA